MSNAQPEPSMEEILASIRRIISEDEEDGAVQPQPTAVEATVESHPRPALVEAETEEDVTDVETSLEESGDVAENVVDEQLDEINEQIADFVEAEGTEPRFETEDVEMIKKQTAQAITGDDEMLGETSAAAATAAFQNLSQSIRVSDGEGRTLEDIVVELLKPMVKEWLDANLPAIVEEKVEEEVQRVARRRG